MRELKALTMKWHPYDRATAGKKYNEYSSLKNIYYNGNSKLETTDSGTNVTGNIVSNIRSNPKGFSVTHTVDSTDNALLVGPINVDSGVTLTVNGTLMVV